jgi:hypothetical protein
MRLFAQARKARNPTSLTGKKMGAAARQSRRNGDKMSREPAVKKGDLVDWGGKSCRVLRRRRVTGLAMFSTSEFEAKLMSLDGDDIGWVGENEITKIVGETSGS